MVEETVYASRLKGHMAFEVCVDKCSALSLIEQINVKCDELMRLSRELVGVLSVETESHKPLMEAAAMAMVSRDSPTKGGR